MNRICLPSFFRRVNCCRAGVVLLVLVLGLSGVSRAAMSDDFAKGLEFSQAGQFPEAAAAFEKAAKTNPSAGTFLNLGLAEWQRGHAGAAMVAWEQARWINPFDSRAENNLKFAREAAQVDPPQLKWHEAVSTWLPPNAWVWLAGVSLWLAVGLLILPGILRRRKAGWQPWLAALSVGVFLFSLAANYGVVSRTHLGFVIKKNATVRLTPTQDGEVVLTLTSGESARVLRTRGKYFYIHTPGTSGWMEQDDFRLICPP